MLENTNVQEINDAIVILRELNADEKMRYASEMREMRLHDEANAIEGSKEEGIAEGMKKGMAKGMKKGASEERRNSLATLKKMGLSDEQIQLFIKAREEL